jgi:spermidine/putrescine transport system permease protein
VIARLKSASGPYLSVLPGGLWLAIFFVLPLFVMVSLSLQTGNLIDGFQQTFHFANYSQVISLYHVQLLRSLW